jgi:hypothetical protein
LHFFFLKRYLFKYPEVPTFIKWDILQVVAILTYRTPCTRYQTLVRENGSDC